MKTRITFLLLFLSAFTFQCGAQKYLNVYQDNIVIKRIPTTEIDSISVTQSTPRTVNMWYNGQIFLSYAAEEIDSVVVSNVEEPISYIGIVGFNDELYKKDIGVLSSSTVGQYKSFVNSLPQKDGTLLYYAVDNALDMLESANLKTRVRDVSFITFTDGLDMGSTMMNDRYWTARDYLNAMSRRIKNTQVQGLSLNAFTVGLRGNDVTDVALFKNNIISLASSPDNAFEVSNISEFRARLQDIANKIISVSNRQTVSVKVPGIDNGSRMRFIFDGQQATNSQMYIEGTFNMQDRSLHNVTYHGIRSRSGSVVQGTQTGIFLTFTFTGLQRLDGLGLIPMNNIKHYYQTPSLSTWQINSEFQPGNNTQRTTNYTGTAIFLVLDCSSSLGGDISKMKSYANDFISLVAGNALPVDVQTPKNLKAEIIESGGKQAVQLTWNWARFAETYDIYRSSSSSGNFTCIAKDVTETAYIDEEPLNGANYYRIVGNGYGMSGTASATAYVSVILKSPQNVIAALDDTRFVINVSWEPVKYAQYYRIYRNGTLVADNITSTSWTDAAPNSGNNYYNVTALGYGLVSAQSSNSKTVNYALQTPANVKAAMDDTDFVINVNWDAVKYAKSYTIFRNGTQIAEGITTNHWTDQSPRAGSNYYSVKALCDGHVSSLSANSESVNYALDTPQDVNAAIADDKFVINVTWTPVKYAEFYRVYRSSRNSSSYFSIVADSVYSTTWQDVSPLSGDNYYRIYAVSHGVTSSASNVSGLVKYALAIPQNVTASMDDNDFIIHVNWDAVKYAESYTIYRNGTQVAEGITSTSWNDASPRSGNNYYSVKAVGHGITSSSSSNSQTISCSLSAPTNVTAALDDNDFIIHVNWDAVKYAESYTIYRNGTQVAEGITTMYWTDENPRSGSNYYSVKAVGHGMTSNSSSTTESINYSLAAPQNVQAALDDDIFAINVTWDSVKYAEYYRVHRSSSSSSGFTLVADNITSSFWQDPTPLKGNNYYRVYAVYHDQTSYSISNVVKYEMPAPQNVQAALDDDVFAINVTWDGINYAEYYKVYRSSSSSGSYTLVADSVTTVYWQDKTPLKGNNYYRVYAVGFGFTSQASNCSDVANYIISAPQNVVGNKVMIDNKYAVFVSWDRVKYADYYKIYRSSSASTNYTLLKDSVKETSWIDISPNRANYYRIIAVGNGQNSSASTSDLIQYGFEAPQNVVAKLSEDKTNVIVSWDEVENAEEYTIYRNIANSEYWERVGSTQSNLWTDFFTGYNPRKYKITASGHGIFWGEESEESNSVSIESIIPPKESIQVIANGVTFKMIKVNSGTLWFGAMWCTLDDYYICETEITQDLWSAVMGTNPSRYVNNSNPVENISLDDCMNFISKLNEITGLSFRFPTVVEWNYAYKGGNYSKGYEYSGSNSLDDLRYDCAHNPYRVAKYQANELGLYDMEGNVSELCKSSFGSSNYVYLGCSWQLGWLTSSGRSYDDDFWASFKYALGLRLAMTP